MHVSAFKGNVSNSKKNDTYNSCKTDWDDNIKHRHISGGCQQT